MASLTKESRDALPADDFAVPGKRALPIHDATHVRLAHSMVDRASGLTDAERTEAKRRIQERAKSLGIDTAEWNRLKAMRLDCMAVELPQVDDHPNRMPFKGVLTKIGEASNGSPHGAGGKLVTLSRKAADAALASLIGMAVDFTPDFDGHDPTRKIAVILGATVENDDLCIEGIIYAADFPTEAQFIKDNKDKLGFSFEAQQIYVESLETDPMVITSCVFTGAAVLFKDKAAFMTTSLAASRAAGDLKMTNEELEAILAKALAPITAELTTLKASQAELGTKIEAGKELHAKIAPFAEKLRACASGMSAAGVGVHSTRGHVAILNRMADGMEAEAMTGSMPHIFRDHDYYGGTNYAATEQRTDPANAEPSAAEKALTEQVKALGTQLADLKAAKVDASPAPERKTISPQITTLLAKAGYKPDDNGKVSVAALDASLSASTLSPRERMEIKANLNRAGLLEAA